MLVIDRKISSVFFLIYELRDVVRVMLRRAIAKQESADGGGVGSMMGAASSSGAGSTASLRMDDIHPVFEYELWEGFGEERIGALLGVFIFVFAQTVSHLRSPDQPFFLLFMLTFLNYSCTRIYFFPLTLSQGMRWPLLGYTGSRWKVYWPRLTLQ